MTSSPAHSSTHLILIPSYNSGDLVVKTVREVLSTAALPIWVVVDGSDDGSAEALEELTESESNLRVLRLARNQGKGASILRGAREALAKGFTHILTMDADGQHPASSIPEFIEASKKWTEALVLGQAEFDETAPRARIPGRPLSNFLANVETLWAGIGDARFGMRIYPLEPFVEVMNRISWARRFDFDPEIAVRLCWEGLRPVNLNTSIRFLSAEEGGISHFHWFKGNLLLFWMHLRLLTGFLLRLPRLIARKRKRQLGEALKDPESSASLQQFREQIAKRYRSGRFRRQAEKKLRSDPVFETVLAELQEHGGSLPLLDVGCGIGLLAVFLREHGLKNPILGCDRDRRKIKAARKVADEHYPDVEFQVADAREGIPDFNGNVVLRDVLELYPPDEQEFVLKAAASAVAPGGILIIRNGLADGSWRFRMARWLRPGARAFPTGNRIRFVLEDAGLEGDFRPFRGRSPFNNDWLAVFRKLDQVAIEQG